MPEQNEINEHWPVGESHRRLLQYQSEVLTLTEFEVLMKSSFGIVFSYCLVYILKMQCFYLIRINFFLAVEGANIIPALWFSYYCYTTGHTQRQAL